MNGTLSTAPRNSKIEQNQPCINSKSGIRIAQNSIDDGVLGLPLEPVGVGVGVVVGVVVVVVTVPVVVVVVVVSS